MSFETRNLGGVPIVKVSEVVGREHLVTKILIFDCTDKKSGMTRSTSRFDEPIRQAQGDELAEALKP
jgi:hypothetical protein